MINAIKTCALFLLPVYFVYAACELVSIRYQLRKLNTDISVIQVQQERLESEWKYLQLDRSRMMTGANLIKEVQEKLKMYEPSASEVLYLPDTLIQ
ncbi:cell division protein FtsL [Basilea psittacipulmonis]|uniref:Cell division protein FtsL n=1 Tax=Basilea psittacipulmonis DSM 24701 TaxID=1072685 RepID=A0A077DCI9_9BURK|nr:cell division protein FtsL [Basilea psittacipulmonis]AIL32314.1 hypothetical protein IX83_02375 [Basilea psittacipulmonis DSM 24701]